MNLTPSVKRGARRMSIEACTINLQDFLQPLKTPVLFEFRAGNPNCIQAFGQIAEVPFSGLPDYPIRKFERRFR